MYELEQKTLTDSAIAMYIAVAPRDPRDPEQAVNSHFQYLEPVSVEELSSTLTELGVPAQLIDGAHIGAPGWLIARTVGVDEGLALRWAPEENTTTGEFPTLSFEDLAATLAQKLNTACHVADHPSVPSTHSHLDGHVIDLNQRSSALVGQFKSTDGPLLAHALQDDLWFSYGNTWSIVVPEAPETYLDVLLAFNPHKPSALFERNGAWRRVTILYRNYVSAHEWGPTWKNVDPRNGVESQLAHLLTLNDPDPATFVFDFFNPPKLDSKAVGDIFELDQTQQDRLELVLNSPLMDDPLTAVSRILGLPQAAAEIAEGWRDIRSSNQVTRIQLQPFPQAVWASATTVPLEHGLPSALIKMWIERPVSYYVVNSLQAFACAAMTRHAHRSGRKCLAGLLGTLTAITVADFFVPAAWRGKKHQK